MWAFDGTLTRLKRNVNYLIFVQEVLGRRDIFQYWYAKKAGRYFLWPVTEAAYIVSPYLFKILTL
jgi:hypothetical protein